MQLCFKKALPSNPVITVTTTTHPYTQHPTQTCTTQKSMMRVTSHTLILPSKQNNDTPLNNRLIGGLIAGEEAIYRIGRRMTCTPNKNHVPRLWRTEYWTLPSRMGLNRFSVSSNLLRHSLSSVSGFLKDSHGDVTQGHVSKSSSSLRNLVVKEGTLQIRSFKLTYNT